jgi:hypothetical protein
LYVKFRGEGHESKRGNIRGVEEEKGGIRRERE